jgi:hypothetical protein
MDGIGLPALAALAHTNKSLIRHREMRLPRIDNQNFNVGEEGQCYTSTIVPLTSKPRVRLLVHQHQTTSRRFYVIGLNLLYKFSMPHLAYTNEQSRHFIVGCRTAGSLFYQRLAALVKYPVWAAGPCNSPQPLTQLASTL